MKVLHVIDALGVGGGAEHSLAQSLPLLRQRGVDSSVVCLFPRMGGLQQQLTSDGFSVEVLRQQGTLSKVRQLRALIRENSPDVVHATLTKASLISRLACIGLGTAQLNSRVNTTYDPVLIDSLGVNPWKIRLLLLIDRVTARTVNGGFHALTSAVRRETIEVLHVEPARVTVIPRGRSAALLGASSSARREATRAQLGLASEDLVVLNVGRQDRQKAQSDLVNAFTRVAAVFPSVKLIIAGREGSGSAALNAAIDRSPSRNRIMILGHRSDVPDLLCASDVFAFPSQYEGLGGVLIEAMALKCPIVASDAPAIAEVLGHGQWGRLFPRGDISALADAIIALLDNAAERRRLSDLGYGRFVEEYQLDRVIDRTLSLYTQIVRSAHSPLR